VTSGVPLFVVLAGRPGTGKTTLGRRLAGALRAAFVRIDAIEAAVLRCGIAQRPVGPVGYVAAKEIAAGTLSLGVSVVVDAVNPVPEARAMWREVTKVAPLVVFETVLTDRTEHRRRVILREPDLVGQVVPTWQEVLTAEYFSWDEARDGPRQVIDMTDSEAGVAMALDHLRKVRTTES
jgi:predicted kinase